MNDTVPILMNWRTATLLVLAGAISLNLVALWWKEVERQSTLWLAAFAGALVVTSTPYVIGFMGAYDRWPGLTFLPVELGLLFGPLFYIHAHTLMKGPVRRVRLYQLLAPGFVYWLYQIWAFTSLGDYTAKWRYNDAIHEPYISPLVFLLSIALGVGALIAVYRMKKDYDVWIDNRRADGPSFSPVWLIHFLYLALLLLIILGLEYGLGLAFGLDYFQRYWATFGSLIIVHVLTLSAFAQIQFPFPKMDAAEAEPQTPTSESGRDWSQEGLKLKSLVETNEWFLEPRFSLDDIARRAGLNQSYASRAINRGLGVSFNHFINEMRVEHAKSLIDAGASNFLEVAHASGFGSKASFNRAFRQHTQQTPSQYRASLSQIS